MDRDIPARGWKFCWPSPVICQQENADSGSTNDPITLEQALLRESWCVGLAQFNNQRLFPKSKHHIHKYFVWEFQSLGLMHETYNLAEMLSVCNVRCCGLVSVEKFGS